MLFAFLFSLGIILCTELSYGAVSHRGERYVSSASGCAEDDAQAVAMRLKRPLDQQGFPQIADWERARPLSFCSDWQGNNADPQRETQVRLLWSPQFLYLRFRNTFREIHVFPESNQRRDHLWDRDVAEVFLQPDGFDATHYKEFEVSPSGNWIDLVISPAGGVSLECALKARAAVDRVSRVWSAELALPMKCLTENFDPSRDWRVNFFRAEGIDPHRFYSAWRATRTPHPNFHVPERFGTLKFSSE
jgi:alpha-galactosidase